LIAGSSFQSNWSNYSRDVRTFFKVVAKEIKVEARYPINLVCQGGMLFIFAGLFGSAWMMFGGGLKGVGIALAGLIVSEFLTDSLWGVGFSIAWERFQGTLESFYLTPVNRFASIIARFGVAFLWMPMALCVCLGMLYIIGSPIHILKGLGVLVLVFPMLAGLGCIFAGICLLYKQTGQLLINFTQFGCMIFCAFFFPFSALPEPMLWISRAIPLSYGVDAFRATLLDTAPELLTLQQELLVLGGCAIVMPVIGYGVYLIAEHRVLVKGGLRMY